MYYLKILKIIDFGSKWGAPRRRKTMKKLLLIAGIIFSASYAQAIYNIKYNVTNNSAEDAQIEVFVTGQKTIILEVPAHAKNKQLIIPDSAAKETATFRLYLGEDLKDKQDVILTQKMAAQNLSITSAGKMILPKTK